MIINSISLSHHPSKDTQSESIYQTLKKLILSFLHKSFQKKKKKKERRKGRKGRQGGREEKRNGREKGGRERRKEGMKGGREEERKERNIDSFYDAHKILIVQERKSPTQSCLLLSFSVTSHPI